MELPNRENAFIAPAKLTEYLLSETHPIGKSKARFLRQAGFDQTNTDVLEQRILGIAHSQEITETVSSVHGTKYIIDGPLETPRGATIPLRTVWIIDTGDERPRFVTAHPT